MTLPGFDFLIAVVSLTGNFFLGLFTYLKNPKSSTHKLFLIFTAALGTYLLVNYLALHQNSDVATLFTIRLVMTVAILINYTFFLLAVTYPYSKPQLKPSLNWISALVTLFMLPITLSPLVFQSVNPHTTQPVPGIGIPLFLLHTIVFLGIGVISLLKKFRRSTGVVKTQIRLFLFGAALMFAAILISNFLIVILFKTTAFVGLLPVYTLIFVGAISYAIVRHHFLDIGLIVARTVTFTIVAAGVAALYTIIVYIIGGFFLNISLNLTQLFSLITLTVIIAVSFHRIQNFIGRITDKTLFKGHYDTNFVLQTLSHIMASTLQLDILTHELLDALLKDVHLTRGAFILLDDDVVVDVKSEGFTTPPSFDETQIKLLGVTRNTQIFDELEEGEIKEILRELGLSVVVHLRTEGAQIGLLMLGPKESGDIYSDQDLSLLEIVSPEIAVAIQNSQSYETIRRFNITLQEEIEKATSDLRQANEKLKELDRLKDEFVSLASHELRTPMTAIKSYVWMVQNGKAGEISPKAHEDLDIVYSSTERLIHLVNDMLDISRIESGKIQMRPTKFAFCDLFKQVKEEFSAKAGEHHLALEFNCPDDLPQTTADRDKILQVLENLIGNALKFTPPGGIITTSAKKDGDFLSISIADTGKGIAATDIPKLFNKFSRLGDSLTIYSQPGTGLGLYLSKQYVELHKGQITVTSEIDKGTTFTFTLPII